jgi:hypothetical protein
MLQILLDVLRIELGLRHAEFVGIHSTPSEAFLAIAGDDRSTLDGSEVREDLSRDNH